MRVRRRTHTGQPEAASHARRWLALRGCCGEVCRAGHPRASRKDAARIECSRRLGGEGGPTHPHTSGRSRRWSVGWTAPTPGRDEREECLAARDRSRRHRIVGLSLHHSEGVRALLEVAGDLLKLGPSSELLHSKPWAERSIVHEVPDNRIRKPPDEALGGDYLPRRVPGPRLDGDLTEGRATVAAIDDEAE